MLSLIIFLPILLGAIVCFALPHKQVKLGALAIMILDLLLVLAAAFQFDWSGTYVTEAAPLFSETVRSTFQFREHLPWLEQFQISYTVGADNLSMVMVILTAVLGIFGVLCSSHSRRVSWAPSSPWTCSSSTCSGS